MHRGYFAVWRKIQDHKFYKEKRVYSKFEAWLDILMEAQYQEEPKEIILKMTLFKQHYGEILRSTRGWALRWRWTRGRVTRFLLLLKNMKQIRTTNETQTTRITVLNYSKYDIRRAACDTANGPQTGHERATHEARLKKDKSVKSVKKKATAPIAATFFDKSLEQKMEFLIGHSIFRDADIFIESQGGDKKLICHAFNQLYKKLLNGDGNFRKWEGKRAWAYCEKIVNAEAGIQNARESEKESERHKEWIRMPESARNLANKVTKKIEKELTPEQRQELLQQQAAKLKRNGIEHVE